MFSLDLLYTLGLIALAAVLAVSYLVRVAIKGKAEYERVNKQGGSALLNKGLMEMAYWGMQPVAKLLVFLHITPNQLSWISLIFAILSAACLSVGHFGFGAAFATISALLDSLDGMVARLTGVASDAGEVLDAVIDRYAEFLFLGALVIYYREVPVLAVLALMALAGSFMVSYSTAKAEAMNVSPPKGSMRRPERALYLILGAALSPITIPWLETDRQFGIAIAHPMIVALCLVAVLANVSAVERFWVVAKAIRIRERDQALARKREADERLAREAAEERAGKPSAHPTI